MDSQKNVPQIWFHAPETFYNFRVRSHVFLLLHFCSLRFNMSVQLDLLHGGHVQNLDTFNQCPWRLMGTF